MKLSNSIRRTETQKYALAGALFGFLFPIVATLIRIAGFSLPFNIASAVSVQSTDPLLWIIDSAPFFLGLFAALAGRRQDNLLRLYEELTRQSAELENAHRTLEQRVKDRTLALEQRAVQFQIIANTARTIAAIQDLESLLPEITKLVSEQFKYYHTGIFLLDEPREFAVLKAANSEGGRNMLARQHRLRLDNNSIVGYTALLGEPRIALDVGIDSVFFNNPDLPETRSEMALPLRIGRRVTGVLDVQSIQKNAFTEEDINVLSILADQVAIAIENARLFGEAKVALAESRATFEKYIKQEWGRFGQRARHTGFVYDGKQIAPLSGALKRDRAKSVAQTGSLSLDKLSANVAIPIKLRGQTIGVLDVRPTKGQRQWTQDELALLEAAAERAALALENARLLESAQRRAARERAIGEISSRVGAVSDRDLILQAAVEELGRKIGNAEIIIELEKESH